MARFRRRVMGLVAVLLVAVSAYVLAVFVNGGFETGDFTGWTKETHINPGIGGTFPPVQLSDLTLAGGGWDLTTVEAGATESVPDGLMGASASLRYPKYETHCARVNYQSSGTWGHGASANLIRQTATVTVADVDPSDSKVHVRFALAPVLENPGHPQTQQPYFFAQLYNNTKSVLLFSTFNFAGQAGVPWQVFIDGAGRTWNFTDWQALDIAPGNALLAVGDSVELVVVASGCSPTGHDGHVYVDGIGAFVPGLFVSVTGPQSANANTDITYTYTYKNGGTSAVNNVTVDAVTPVITGGGQTTYVSLNAPGGTCTNPGVGNAGTVSCNFGTLNPAATGTFTITVHIPTGSTGTVNNGNYDIYGTGVTPLIGPLFITAITGATLTDLAATKTDGVAAVGWGGTTTYTLQVTNNGPTAVTGATVADALPANVASWSWTCVGSGGATCTAGPATTDINDSANIAVGGSVTYIIVATLVAGTGTGTVVNTATVTPPGGITDSDNTNNTAVDTDIIGTLRTLTLTKSGSGTGTVVSSPAAINCGTACPGASAQFVDGTSVGLTATADTNSHFTGWSGACTGTTNPCVFTISADTSLDAAFDLNLATVTTTVPSAITATTAASGGDVTADGGTPVTVRGVCWSLAANPTTADTCTSDGTGTGVFPSALSGLTPGTVYHVRAYATNGVGTAYGADEVFTTLGSPTVTTTVPSAITTTTASSGGDVTSDGGSPVTVRGVCWSLAANPTTADTCTSDGAGTGVFTSALSGLTPATTYHVRAYGTNGVGTGYGEDMVFRTEGEAAIPTFSQAGLLAAILLLGAGGAWALRRT